MEGSDKLTKSSCGLLALLPKPKNTNTLAAKLKTSSDFLISKKVDNPTPLAAVKRKSDLEDVKVENKKQCLPTATVSSLVSYDSSSESENDEEENDLINADKNEKKIDFFGINSNSLASKIEKQLTSSQLQPLVNDVIIGPAKPDKISCSYPTIDDENESNTKSIKLISDQQVSKLIYDKELAPYGGSTIMAAEAASSIIDVSVDQALGPGLRENLLKNLNNKALAQMSIGPLPKVKKDSNERLAKQKHQITHLAGLAVAREELLQEKWAENKQKMRASAKRYGF